MDRSSFLKKMAMGAAVPSLLTGCGKDNKDSSVVGDTNTDEANGSDFDIPDEINAGAYAGLQYNYTDNFDPNDFEVYFEGNDAYKYYFNQTATKNLYFGFRYDGKGYHERAVLSYFHNPIKATIVIDHENLDRTMYMLDLNMTEKGYAFTGYILKLFSDNNLSWDTTYLRIYPKRGFLPDSFYS